MSFLYSQFLVRPTYPTASLAGQTIIVTGSNTGLGKEAARHFARLGAFKVILAVRNIAAGEAAKKDIETSTKCRPSTLEVWSLDLSSFASVEKFAARASALPRIDVLLSNAGIATEDFELVEGHERTITINVISTFLLIFLLLPKLRAVAKEFGIKPRAVVVSSEVHDTPFPEATAPNIFAALDDPATARMGELQRYSTSKLLEILVVRAIAPMLANTGVVLNLLNPGLCHSELSRDITSWVFWAFKMLLARSTEMGSRTLVAGAIAGEESHGKYMGDGVVADGRLSAFVRSDEGGAAAKKVWAELKALLEGVKPGVTNVN